MKLDEAIEILTDILRNGTEPGYPIEEHAIKMSIEALKRLQEYRSRKVVSEYYRLPGETKD